ncbi:hypothetical protein [Pseudooceanicola spongiae]|uniref:Uncharacterized protein n=1 Tax=Pseudooceanicola spongiae TaxID=2613965 RepID=A0A7L9WK06_9RHOB|nr:hypothetical protein [Pseudooceanicola spongiae]QOL80725.1 hypothetical protein F3W81_07800 [Pseudooceanicola spongiae]
MSEHHTPLLRHLILTSALLLSLGACNRPPALDATLSAENRAAARPRLVPASQILSRATTEARLAPVDDDALAARAEALRQRAETLRQAEIGL